jgi:hypothetical protein
MNEKEQIEYTGWRLDHIEKNFEKVDLVFSRMIIIPEDNNGQVPCCMSDTVHRMESQTVDFHLTIAELLDACTSVMMKKYEDAKKRGEVL